MARYLLILFLTVAGIAGPVALLNVSSDPFDVFAVLRGPHTIRLDTSLRMSKAYAMRSVRPDCVILGTSRAELGYRVLQMPSRCQRPYNAAVPGARVNEARRHLEHALALGPVSEVFLALDLEMFADRDNGPDFNDARLAVTADGRRAWFPAGELVALALGREATTHSWIMRSAAPAPPAVLPTGDRNNHHLSRVVFVKPMADELRSQFLHLRSLMGGGRAYPLGQHDAPMRDLARILELCRLHGIPLRIAFNPVHASVHEFVRLVDLLPTYLDWKARIIDIAATAATEQDLELWDFGLINDTTAEPIDLASAVTSMRSYWEPSHFRDNLGARVLTAIYAGVDARDIGHRLIPEDDPAAVSSVTLTAALQEWSRTQPELAARIAAWARDSAPRPH